MSVVTGTRTLGRLNRLVEKFKLPGSVRGDLWAQDEKVHYYLGSQHLGGSSPEARNMLYKMAGQEKPKEKPKEVAKT